MNDSYSTPNERSRNMLYICAAIIFSPLFMSSVMKGKTKICFSVMFFYIQTLHRLHNRHASTLLQRKEETEKKGIRENRKVLFEREEGGWGEGVRG